MGLSVASDWYSPISWLPVSPALNLTFKLLMALTRLIKSSSLAFHETPAEGKYPHLLLAPNFEEPSARPETVML